MATPKRTVCEVCRERPATHHICFGGTGKTSDFCNECFETSAPLEVRESTTAMREAHCQYCGGQPWAGGTDILAMLAGEQRMSFMCMPCAMEFHRFMQQEAVRIPQNSSQQEQLAAIRMLQGEADRHMKQWVSQRGSP